MAYLWSSPSPLVSSINKTDRHEITKIMFKVVLNTITLTIDLFVSSGVSFLSVSTTMCVYFFAQFQGENYRLKITKRQNQDET